MASLSNRDAATICTIGHSNRSFEALADLLEAHGIERLVDVRSFPRSRHNPQFNRETLAEALPERGIAYEHRRSLGGHRKPRPDSPNQGWHNAGFRGYADYMQSADFTSAIEALINLGRESHTAIMCAEALPWRCHRWLISDALLVRGCAVRHIHAAGRADEHRLTAFAERDGTRLLYPFALSSRDDRTP